MRIVTFITALALSMAWILALNNPQGALPAMGKLMDPVKGLWGNAEPVNKESQLRIPGYNHGQEINVPLSNRLVPHITAANDETLYYVQGYLHAYFRLWQMDMQTRAAAGRISEVAGEKAFEFDRTQRRKGMIWAAENSLKVMEADGRTRKILDAYTKGVNTFIKGLTISDYPLEYKLMGFEPEPWTNLKCALLLKYMADDLTGNVDDIAMTYIKDALPPTEMDDLFPEKIAGSQPVIPLGTTFPSASRPLPSVPAGDLFAHFDTLKTAPKNTRTSQKKLVPYEPGSGMGSNNWVVGGQLTASGAPILCNDPHLGLNLPAIWYEMQLTGPEINCYGVSIPGAPGIIIGFNDSISWGFTNNYRDVKDFYEIRTEDPRLYFFNGKEVPFNERFEKIYIKDQEVPFIDTIRFTIHGPLMYDEHFPEPSGSGKVLAMTWMAHRGTNELLSVYLYNRANNYDQFVKGIQHFECPAQNFVYADRVGNIAIWGQGRFINKWKDQGKFVMRGDISATLWGDTIPMSENPHLLNPPQNYLASANQNVTSPTYPYWYNGDFTEFRSWVINHELIYRFAAKDKKKDSASSPTPAGLYGKDGLLFPFIFDLTAEPLSDIRKNMDLQNSTLSILNATIKYNPVIASQLNTLPDSLKNGGDYLSPNRSASTFAQLFWTNLYNNIWQDDFLNFPVKLYPSPERTMQLLRDSSLKYYDDRKTPGKESLRDMVTKSMQQAQDSIAIWQKKGGAEWYKVKNTSVTHLAKLPAFSYQQLKTGGWGNTVNAMKQNHGPSWRMIVEMNKDKIQAFAVYPGGQSGNPGSRFYADFLDYWVEGKYYDIDFKPRPVKTR